MKLEALAMAGAMMVLAASASAASLCNCCGASTAARCAPVCAPVKPAEGQCVATVDYGGRAKIRAGINPLYDVSLRNIWLGSPKRTELEAFRRLLERARRGVEKDRRASLRAYARGKIGQAAATARAKRYDDAIVNYYLGLRSYRTGMKGE
jgi:hypothetical protein